VLLVVLTGNTTFGGRVRVKPLPVDSLPASHAHTVCAHNDASKRRIDIAKFLNLARDLGEIHVDKKIGECFVLRVVDLTGDLEVLLLIAAQ